MTNKQNIQNKNSGVTLMEVMVAMFISVAVIMASYSIYLVSTRSYNRGEKVTEITQNGRIATDRIVRDIRQAVEIATADFPTQQPGSAEIEFQDGHATNPIGDIQYIKYYLDAADLHKQRLFYYCDEDSQDVHVYKLFDCHPETPEKPAEDLPIPSSVEDNVIAEKISNLEFYGQRLITINFSVTDENETFPFTTKVFGRNIP